ncbi:hypothetical protein [Rossellomorea aquimaris]|uniref:hypothetical protein n=1 Tax=Rossellomorea aquimaris TaxID=189382 RepID=UPI001CFE6EB4|nr:hypothetical protein [Rossellomorea aquimaris]
MAMDLTATFRLIDNFSRPMDRINRHMNTAERAMRSLDERTRRTGRSVNTFGSGLRRLGGMTKGLFGVQSAFLGIASAIGSAAAAKKIFESTVIPAAQFEQSNVMIEAMFDDKKLAKEYTKMLDRISVKSPILDSAGMYQNSKSFITTSKDVKQLEKMWNLAERMAAIDPIQGVEGSVFALKELFSGDAVSMVERFEMPRAIMNDIKKLELPQQLAALDKYFDKIGMTQKLIDNMGGTTLGLWQQVREQFSLLLRDMGEPSLKVLSGFFSNIITKLQSGELDGFAAMGGKIIERIISGMANGATRIYEYFQGLSNDPAFQAQTTLFGKLEYIFGDFFAAYEKWLNEDGGQEKINNAMHNLLVVGSAALLASQDMIVKTATTIGVAIGSAMFQAAKSGMISQMNSWLSSWKVDKKLWGDSKPIPGPFETTWKVGSYIGDKFKSHASGLSNVPYNGYQANLHKGERVLTPEENREYTKGGNKSVQFGDIHLHGVGGDMRKAADELMSIMARRIEMGGV